MALMLCPPSAACFLMVCVDDFKMAGPKGNLKTCWEALTSIKGKNGQPLVELGPVAPVTHYLGCETMDATVEGIAVKRYRMMKFMTQCVELYEKVAQEHGFPNFKCCLLYTSPSPRDGLLSRMPSSA